MSNGILLIYVKENHIMKKRFDGEADALAFVINGKPIDWIVIGAKDVGSQREQKHIPYVMRTKPDGDK